MSIGIAITTRNRRDVFLKTYAEIKKHAPKGARIVVVDDASATPCEQATFQFEFQAGIAKAKNKCLELLEGCDYLFLFDDDCYPTKKGWEKVYINSGLAHACYNFTLPHDGIKPVETRGNFTVWSSPRGCMLFFTRNAIQTAGGFDEAFGVWGYEHVELSARLRNLGVTPAAFIDVVGSSEVLHSMDEKLQVSSTTPERHVYINANRRHYMSKVSRSDWQPYMPNRRIRKPVLLTSYFNAAPDPQRGGKWDATGAAIRPLIESAIRTQTPLVIFHDCLQSGFVNSPFIQYRMVAPCPTKTGISYRWMVYYDYLQKHHHTAFFCIDSTDVIIQRNPFGYILPGTIYCGDEVGNTWDNVWVQRHNEPHVVFEDYFQVKDGTLPLLNAGIVGGYFDAVFPIVETLQEQAVREARRPEVHADMATLNYAVRKSQVPVVHGLPVNTRFKYYEDDSRAWFKHK
jgi:hypothetical protein